MNIDCIIKLAKLYGYTIAKVNDSWYNVTDTKGNEVVMNSKKLYDTVREDFTKACVKMEMHYQISKGCVESACTEQD
jgi:hypothetical protein